MFCDNCGKSNARGVLKCAYCGNEMPKITETTGFSDILTYKSSGTTDTTTSYEPTTVNGEERKESGAEMKKAGNVTKNSKIGLIALVISVLILLYSSYTNMKTLEKIDSYRKTVDQKLDAINVRIDEIETRTDKIKEDTWTGSKTANSGILMTYFANLENLYRFVITPN